MHNSAPKYAVAENGVEKAVVVGGNNRAALNVLRLNFSHAKNLRAHPQYRRASRYLYEVEKEVISLFLFSCCFVFRAHILTV